MSRRLKWEIDGLDWPNREHSRFLESGGMQWHTQKLGDGPLLVLLHGTGAATSSWRDVAPLLAERHTVIAIDLPGHGFTSPPRTPTQYTLNAVAQSVRELLAQMRISPTALIGHSAGAAIAVRMAIDAPAQIKRVVGVNAALEPFPGAFAAWAPFLARALFFNPLAIAVFAARASQPGAVRKLLQGTGSDLDETGVELYTRLFRSPAHVEATIGLMAHWDLIALRRDLPRLRAPVTLLVGAQDKAVPPATADRLRGLVADLNVVTLPGLGHLAHEEDPQEVASAILCALKSPN